MRDRHRGALRTGRTDLGDNVVRGALGKQLAEVVLAAGQIVPQRRRNGRTEHRPPKTMAPADKPGDGTRASEHRQRNPVVTVRLLDIDSGVGAGSTQLRGDLLGGHALTVRRGGTLDCRQLADPLAKPAGVHAV
jgi:hypothetical protein